MFILDLFKPKDKRDRPLKQGRGLLVFDHTSEVIRAEKLLKANGWEIKVMGPPPEIQKGCDLVIEIPLMEELNISRLLEQNELVPLEMVPVTGPLLKPVDLFHTKYFSHFVMVRAANMKITLDKNTGTIVNISGGGCPDVPYLAAELVGKPLKEAPRPKDLGHTLCGYALELAFAELERICSR